MRLPSKDSRAGQLIRTRLQHLGLFRASGHEHLRGSLTVPIPAADGTGRVVNVYGRKVQGEHLRKGTALHVHTDDRRPGVWNVGAFGPAEEIVVCRSVFDALTLWTHGYRNVTCSFGVISPDLLAALTEFNVQRVFVTDEAVVEKLLAAGIEVFFLRLPPGLDVNAFALKTADPADALGALLRHAEWAGRGRPPAGPAPRPLPVPSAAAAADLLAEDDEDDREDAEADDPEPDAAAENDHDAVPVRDMGVPVEPPVRTASPVPSPPPADDVTITDAEVVMTFGTRRYRVRGFDANAGPGQMRVNLLVGNGVGLFVDSFDLYGHKHRKSFVEQAAQELRVEEATVKKDVGKVLLKLEELQDAARTATAKPATRPDMTAEDERAALDFLRSSDLLDRIANDFAVVGTRTNKLVAYLAAVSRKLDRPLGVVVQSASAAGKTTLVDAALAFVPAEDKVAFSAVTGQSLYYLGVGSLKNKVLSVAEEAGASRAAYALKLLQSDGRLTIAGTGKADTGRLVTQTYTVEGPVALFTTTTSSDVDEELLNRCLLLAVDEDRDQTRAVHKLQRQRETLAGLVAAEDHAAVVKLHQDAQRLLKPIKVVNPWAEKLTFSDAKTRTRRDHAKYLALIRVTSFIHQHQRPVRTAEVSGKVVEYVETTLEDIAAANELAAAVLGRGLDELHPQTRSLVVLLEQMVTAACETERIDRAGFRFTTRQARDFCGWGQSQLKLHLKRLLDHEFVLAHRDRHARRNVYELAVRYDGEGRAVPGLIDVDELRRAEWSDGGENGPGFSGQRPGLGRGIVGAQPGHRRGLNSTTTPVVNKATADAQAGLHDGDHLVPEPEVLHAEER